MTLEPRMIISEGNAIRRICSDLGLPEGDAYTQEWAHELPDEFRGASAFYDYVRAYSNPAYGDAERRVLAQLALDVANDLLGDDEEIGRAAWNTLAAVLRVRSALHADQLEYWALHGEPLEDAFPLTPHVRDLLNELAR